MREVPTTEAKSRFAELLRVVEYGESIAITRHGKTVAHLVPAGDQERASQRDAVERFRVWRRERPSYRDDEGRDSRGTSRGPSPVSRFVLDASVAGHGLTSGEVREAVDGVRFGLTLGERTKAVARIVRRRRRHQRPCPR